MRYHNYIFLTTDKSFSSRPPAYQKGTKTIFSDFFNKTTAKKDIEINTYATVGLKVNTSILLWLQANNPERIQDVINELLHTEAGAHITITHTLFGLSRPSQYSHATDHNDTTRRDGKYLIVYPFNKTQDWYLLPFTKRQELMKGHIAVGKKYIQISQLLLYSYGVDDNEFIVSYTTDDLFAFQTLVMELRTDKGRVYTLKDTPIFTCIYKTFEEIINYL